MSTGQSAPKTPLSFKVISINRTVKDFIAATRHLSVEDRGAYQEILDQIVEIGQDEEPPSLPDDPRYMANLMGWPIAKWKVTRRRLCFETGAPLVVVNGRISQSRIVKEIDEARARIQQASDAGKASAEAKKARKTDALRARMVNGSSNGKATGVATSVELPLAPRCNSTGNSTSTSHELRVTTKPLASKKKKSSTNFSKKKRGGQKVDEKQYHAIVHSVNKWLDERRELHAGISDEDFQDAFERRFGMTTRRWESMQTKFKDAE